MSRRKLILISISLALVFTTVQTLVLVWLGISIENSLIDSSVSNVLLAIIAYYLGNILRYYRPGKSKFFYIFIWDSGISAAWLLTILWVLPLLIKDPAYIDFLSQIFSGKVFCCFSYYRLSSYDKLGYLQL